MPICIKMFFNDLKKFFSAIKCFHASLKMFLQILTLTNIKMYCPRFLEYWITEPWQCGAVRLETRASTPAGPTTPSRPRYPSPSTFSWRVRTGRVISDQNQYCRTNGNRVHHGWVYPALFLFPMV